MFQIHVYFFVLYTFIGIEIKDYGEQLISDAGSAVAMIGANLRFGIGAFGNVTSNATKVFQCHPGGVTEATVIFSLGAMGMGANIVLMALILVKRQLRRYE